MQGEIARIAILGGYGRVGLPLAVTLAEAGVTVLLIDPDRNRGDLVKAGQMPFLETDGDLYLQRALRTGRLKCDATLADCADVDAVIVTVGTPVDEYMNPSLAPFERVVDQVTANMKDGGLLIIRSTVFPGVTERLHRRYQEAGRKIHVAYCPERIAEGRAFAELTTLPQLVGATDPIADQRASELFLRVTSSVIKLRPVEAELAKLFSNAYRYINFAIANQFFMISSKFDVDYNTVADSARADYPRLSGLPRSGFAAGPCLLKDTMQLASFNHHDFPLGLAAMTVNEGLPNTIIDMLRKQHPLATMKVGILGMAFKADSDDTRSSIAYKLRKLLRLHASEVMCTDPFVQDPDFKSLEEVLAECDLLVIGAPHTAYRSLQPKQPLIDVFGLCGKGMAT